MGISRRQFLKISGTSLAGAAFGAFGFDLSPIEAYAYSLKTRNAQQTTTICPYCAVGCGIIVYTVEGRVIATEGDPDHPINGGSLCSKGSALRQLSHEVNPNRLTRPLYRAPYSKQWQEVSWDFAIDRIARNIKRTRDETFEQKNLSGQTVNRTTGMASLGSAAMDNEECYIYQKFLRAVGLVYIEHQARI